MLAMFPCQSRSTSAAGSSSHGAGGEEYGLDKLVFEIYLYIVEFVINNCVFLRLRGLLVYAVKEAAFRKVIQATMVRDKHHGPVIELNRIQVCII